MIHFTGLIKRELRQGENFVISFAGHDKLYIPSDDFSWSAPNKDDTVAMIAEGLSHIDINQFEKITITINKQL